MAWGDMEGQKMKQMQSVFPALLLIAALLCGCSEQRSEIVLPQPVVQEYTRPGTENTGLMTLNDLVDSADCVVVAEMVEETEYYAGATWRNEMRIIRDLTGNVNDQGCPEGSIYVSAARAGVYMPGETYLLFLRASSVIGRPTIVYVSVDSQLIIPCSDRASTFVYQGTAQDWLPGAELAQAAAERAAAHPKAAIVSANTATSYAEAMSQADEIWLIEVQSIEPLTADFVRCDYQILQVLEGAYDIGVPGAAAYREPLPAVGNPQVGQRYLLLKSHTETGELDIVSGEYCLVPSDEPLFRQRVDAGAE